MNDASDPAGDAKASPSPRRELMEPPSQAEVTRFTGGEAPESGDQAPASPKRELMEPPSDDEFTHFVQTEADPAKQP